MCSRRYLLVFAAAAGAFILFSANDGLSQCPGSHKASGVRATAWSSGHLLTFGPLWNFISNGCTHVAFGPTPPSYCSAIRVLAPPPIPGLYSRFTAVLRVGFADPASNQTSNGCTFNCPGGTCIVRGGDGLPVELMQFKVE